MPEGNPVFKEPKDAVDDLLQHAQWINKHQLHMFLDSLPLGIVRLVYLQVVNVILTTEMVAERLQELKPNKAAGPDQMMSRFKECAEEVAPLLQQIYRKSLDEGEVPRQWKDAEIVPIHKGGSKAVMANFRPVALTSIVCKIMEKIVCSVMLAFLTNNNLITKQQHGFVRGRSCQTNILLCLEKWTELVDNGKSVDVAYFDYAKAFD